MRDQSSGRTDNLGRAVGREIATGDRAEAQIDAFISRRDAQRRKSEGDRAEEEAWSKSESRYDAHRRAGNRAAWVDDGLEWDAKREVWVGSDSFAYDGERLFAYSRGGRA